MSADKAIDNAADGGDNGQGGNAGGDGENPADGGNTNAPANNGGQQPAGDAGQGAQPKGAVDGQKPSDNAVQSPTGDIEPRWPDNWRDLLAGDDDKFRKQLERVNSPLDVAKNYRELEKMKAEFKPAPKLPDNPTDDDIAAYRKEMGIPEKPEEYELDLPEGFVFGDADKPYVDMYLQDMHERNMPPDVVNAGLNAYAKIIEQQATEYVERDRADKRDFEDEMRAEWGNEYRANINMAQNFISSAPEEIANMIANGRGPDGKALLNNPGFVKWINNIAREINPAGTIVQGGQGDVMKSIDAELAELNDYRRANLTNGKWHKDDARRTRHRELLEAKQKLEARQG